MKRTNLITSFQWAIYLRKFQKIVLLINYHIRKKQKMKTNKKSSKKIIIQKRIL